MTHGPAVADDGVRFAAARIDLLQAAVVCDFMRRSDVALVPSVSMGVPISRVCVRSLTSVATSANRPIVRVKCAGRSNGVTRPAVQAFVAGDAAASGLQRVLDRAPAVADRTAAGQAGDRDPTAGQWVSADTRTSRRSRK